MWLGKSSSLNKLPKLENIENLPVVETADGDWHVVLLRKSRFVK